MSRDEALLDAVAGDPSTAMMRTYTWSEATLSLGYFQEIAEAEAGADERWHGVPIVRRPTGGGAIWHHHELTYAVVLPATHSLSRPSVALYRAVHSAIGALLRARGVAADRRGLVPTVPGAPRPFLCFQDRDPEDLVVRGFKIVGSAQRRRAGAILQHGSLLLERSPTTPELPGAADLATASANPLEWSELLAEVLPGALDLEGVREPFPVTMCQQAETLERDVYRKAEWNRRR